MEPVHIVLLLLVVGAIALFFVFGGASISAPAAAAPAGWGAFEYIIALLALALVGSLFRKKKPEAAKAGQRVEAPPEVQPGATAEGKGAGAALIEVTFTERLKAFQDAWEKYYEKFGSRLGGSRYGLFDKIAPLVSENLGEADKHISEAVRLFEEKRIAKNKCFAYHRYAVAYTYLYTARFAFRELAMKYYALLKDPEKDIKRIRTVKDLPAARITALAEEKLRDFKGMPHKQKRIEAAYWKHFGDYVRSLQEWYEESPAKALKTFASTYALKLKNGKVPLAVHGKKLILNLGKGVELSKLEKHHLDALETKSVARPVDLFLNKTSPSTEFVAAFDVSLVVLDYLSQMDGILASVNNGLKAYNAAAVVVPKGQPVAEGAFSVTPDEKARLNGLEAELETLNEKHQHNKWTFTQGLVYPQHSPPTHLYLEGLKTLASIEKRWTEFELGRLSKSKQYDFLPKDGYLKRESGRYIGSKFQLSKLPEKEVAKHVNDAFKAELMLLVSINGIDVEAERNCLSNFVEAYVELIRAEPKDVHELRAALGKVSFSPTPEVDEIMKALAAKKAELEKEITDDETQVDKLNGKVKDLLGKTEALEAKRESLEGSIKDKELKRDSMNADLGATEQSVADLSSRLDGLKVGISATRDEINANQNLLSWLSKEIGAKVQERDETLHSENERLTARLRELEGQLADAEKDKQSALAELKTMTSTVGALGADVEAAEQSVADLSTRMAGLKADISATKKELDATNQRLAGISKEIASGAEEQANLRSENERLTARLSELEAQLADAERDKRSALAELEAMTSTAEALEQEIVGLKAEDAKIIEDIKGRLAEFKGYKYTDLDKLLAATSKAKDAARKLLEDRKTIIDSIKRQEARIRELEGTNRELSESLIGEGHKHAEERERTLREKHGLERELNLFRQELDHARESLETLEGEIGILNDRAEAAEKLAHAFDAHLKTIGKKAAEIDSHIANREKEFNDQLRELRRQILRIGGKIDTRLEEIKTLDEGAGKVSDSLDKLSATVEDMGRVEAEAVTELCNMLDQFTAISTKSREAVPTLEAFKRRLDAFLKELARHEERLKGKIADLEAQAEAGKGQAAEAKEANEALLKEKDELEATLRDSIPKADFDGLKHAFERLEESTVPKKTFDRLQEAFDKLAAETVPAKKLEELRSTLKAEYERQLAEREAAWKAKYEKFLTLEEGFKQSDLRLKEVERSLTDLSGKRQDMETRISKIDGALTAIDETEKQIREHFEALQGKIVEKDTEIAGLEIKLKEEGKKVVEHRQAADRIAGSNKRLRDGLDDVSGFVAQAKEAGVEATRAQVKALEAALVKQWREVSELCDQFVQRIATTSEVLDDARSDLVAKKKVIAKLSETSEALKAKLASNKETIDGFRSKKKELEGKIRDLNKAIAETKRLEAEGREGLEAEIRSLVEERDALLEENARLAGQIASLSQENADVARMNAVFVDALILRTEETAGVFEACDKLGSENRWHIEIQEKEAQVHAKKVEGLRRELDRAKKTSEGFEAQVGTLEGTLTELGAELGKKEATLRSLQEALASEKEGRETDITRLERERDALRKDLQSSKRNLNALHGKIVNMQEGLRSAHELLPIDVVSRLSEEIHSIDSVRLDVNAASKSLESSVESAFEETEKRLASRAEVDETAMRGLVEKARGLTDDKDSLNRTIGELQARIEGLKATMKAAEKRYGINFDVIAGGVEFEAKSFEENVVTVRKMLAFTRGGYEAAEKDYGRFDGMTLDERNNLSDKEKRRFRAVQSIHKNGPVILDNLKEAEADISEAKRLAASNDESDKRKAIDVLKGARDLTMNVYDSLINPEKGVKQVVRRRQAWCDAALKQIRKEGGLIDKINDLLESFRFPEEFGFWPAPTELLKPLEDDIRRLADLPEHEETVRSVLTRLEMEKKRWDEIQSVHDSLQMFEIKKNYRERMRLKREQQLAMAGPTTGRQRERLLKMADLYDMEKLLLETVRDMNPEFVEREEKRVAPMRKAPRLTAGRVPEKGAAAPSGAEAKRVDGEAKNVKEEALALLDEFRDLRMQASNLFLYPEDAMVVTTTKVNPELISKIESTFDGIDITNYGAPKVSVYTASLMNNIELLRKVIADCRRRAKEKADEIIGEMKRYDELVKAVKAKRADMAKRYPASRPKLPDVSDLKPITEAQYGLASEGINETNYGSEKVERFLEMLEARSRDAEAILRELTSQERELQAKDYGTSPYGRPAVTDYRATESAKRIEGFRAMISEYKRLAKEAESIEGFTPMETLPELERFAEGLTVRNFEENRDDYETNLILLETMTNGVRRMLKEHEP